VFEIKHRYTGEVICTGDDLRTAVRSNIKRLIGADLRDADLGGADLRGANLRCAYLRGADLGCAKLAWQSHDLLAEILRSAASNDIEKLKIAGYILVCRDKCWREFSRLAARDPLGDWALGTLAKWVQAGDGAPEIVTARRHSKKIIELPAPAESAVQP